MMTKLCPNLENEGELERALEVSIPEDKIGTNAGPLRWHNLLNVMRAHHRSAADKWAMITSSVDNDANDYFSLFLKLVGSAFIPSQAHLAQTDAKPIRDGTIEASTAKYIVQQYVAATGGLSALNSVSSMYAMGQLNMVVEGRSESGGFVVWQKAPDLWYLELVVSGHRVSGGSDGKTNWSQSGASTAASRGPPKPLRRFFQGLDPRSTANLFSNTVCTGEKVVKGESCFILKLETAGEMLKTHDTANTQILYHTIWGYFSQRTGLLVQFEDTKLIRIKTDDDDEGVFYETSMESELRDYKVVDGIKIAHSGTTTALLYRYGKTLKRKWRLEETWSIEDLDFNIFGLSVDHFLPPHANDHIISSDVNDHVVSQ